MKFALHQERKSDRSIRAAQTRKFYQFLDNPNIIVTAYRAQSEQHPKVLFQDSVQFSPACHVATLQNVL